ncbi:Ig domain-containing protein [Corynebacterium tapiri]
MPNWATSATVRPGSKVDIPVVSGAVNGTPVLDVSGPGTATVAPDGTITVTPGADAKPGDVIKVTVKDKNGDVIDTIEINVEKTNSGTGLNWGDVATAAIGGVIAVPIIAGALAGGESVDVSGPGAATLGEDGAISVQVDPDAKPGDVIKVTVKDKDGQAVDTVDVTVTDNGDGTTATITPIGDVTVDEGESITPITVTTSDPKAEIRVTGLPAGVNFDPVTGAISGTPLVPGSYPVTLTATVDGKPVSTEKFTITVGDTSNTGHNAGSSNGAGLIGALLGGLGLGAILGSQGSSENPNAGSSTNNNAGSNNGASTPGTNNGAQPGGNDAGNQGGQTTGQPSQAPGANQALGNSQAPGNGAGNSAPGNGQGQSVTTPAPSSPKSTGQQPGSKPGGALANTGVDDLMVIVGGSLLAMTVGGLLILAAKRRREAESES